MPFADFRAAHLADPAVHEVLRKAVRKLVRPGDVDDIVQTTLVAALADPNYPEKREVFIAWLVTKGRSKAIDHLRSTRRSEHLFTEAPEGDVNVLEHGPAANASETHDATEALRFTQARIDEHVADPRTERGARWLMLHLRGESYEDIADDERVRPETVQHAVARLKRNLNATWITAAALVLLFFLLRGLFGRNTENERARPQPVPSALPTLEPPAPLPPAPTPEEVARDLRNDAVIECRAGEWIRCVEDLQRAGEEDPAGNRDPKIQELLRDARKHLPDPMPDSKPKPKPL
jgi:DNA-directed RNA polymerase specialized sigma24 family protein